MHKNFRRHAQSCRKHCFMEPLKELSEESPEFQNSMNDSSMHIKSKRCHKNYGISDSRNIVREKIIHFKTIINSKQKILNDFNRENLIQITKRIAKTIFQLLYEISKSQKFIHSLRRHKHHETTPSKLSLNKFPKPLSPHDYLNELVTKFQIEIIDDAIERNLQHIKDCNNGINEYKYLLSDYPQTEEILQLMRTLEEQVQKKFVNRYRH